MFLVSFVHYVVPMPFLRELAYVIVNGDDGIRFAANPEFQELARRSSARIGRIKFCGSCIIAWTMMVEPR